MAEGFTELRSAIQDLWIHANMGSIPNWSVGSPPAPNREVSARDVNDLRNWYDLYDPESIIGAQWTNNSRNWTGPGGAKSGSDIQLVYATGIIQATDPNGTTQVGSRVHGSVSAGRNVFVRVDYAPGQSIPPSGNDSARTSYVTFLQSLCGNSSFSRVFGRIIGNEFNTSIENQTGPAVTPTWYARVFNGYNAPVGDTGNAVQFIKAVQPGAQVLVGPVGPWNPDQGSDDGSQYSINMAWLNYFNELCRKIYSGASAKGLSVDGFAIHAYGRPGAINPNTGQPYGSSEPHNDIQGGGWAPGAWAGFTVYKNWRDIINQLSTVVPIWITETNTHTDTDAPSSQSYPSDWYIQALAEISGAGKRFQSVCWFVDQNTGGSPTSPWVNDSLTVGNGNCSQASADFNTALTSTNY
jgi:hypothetical protein